MGRFPSSMQAPSWGPQRACRCGSNSAEFFCALDPSLTRIALVQQWECFGARLFIPCHLVWWHAKGIFQLRLCSLEACTQVDVAMHLRLGS